jgi:hypothetical protein
MKRNFGWNLRLPSLMESWTRWSCLNARNKNPEPSIIRNGKRRGNWKNKNSGIEQSEFSATLVGDGSGIRCPELVIVCLECLVNYSS